jgi:molybdopterin-containing oxidoreductase family membrane subunit
MPLLLAVYDEPGKIAEAARRLRARGYTELETYAPAPFTEVEDAVIDKPSRVRLFTLIGGLIGVVTGYALTIWMSNNWQLVVGGKPFSSIPPYTIIAFELTILFGGLLTVLGMLVFAKLPRFKLDAAYSRRFSAEDFGLTVRCQERDIPEIDALLRAHDAKELTLVEP